MNRLRLLYLGFAFPPGLQAQHPDLNPAGHGFEVQFVRELRKHFDLRSVGLLPISLPASLPAADPDSGVAHELLLEARAPELLFQYRSLWRLRRAYSDWSAAGWQPDLILTYNLSPVYNAFIRSVRRASPWPKLVLLLLDSAQLGRPLPKSKRIRYWFKPLVVPDDAMLAKFDACIGLSRSVGRYFEPHGIPFLWMPGGCTPGRARVVPAGSAPENSSCDPIRFGYFGALAAHAGILEFVKTFLSMSLPATLHVSGYGKLSGDLATIAAQDRRLVFLGLLRTPEHCLAFGQSCDVLVNPRPGTYGNENNFPSKLFEYALCGRAVLSSRLSGVDFVLGPDGYYFDAHDFESGVRTALPQVASAARAELRRRGEGIRERVCAEYNWPKQGLRTGEFLERVVSSRSAAIVPSACALSHE